MSPTDLLIAASFFGAAGLYASVGHAGASGYLAVMALAGFAPGIMKPTALLLNVLVALIATAKFYRAGYFSWSLFWPFALTSVPAAYLGGGIVLRTDAYRTVVGAFLLYGAWRMFRSAHAVREKTPSTPPLAAALLAGLAIGLLSGLTGVGGGIFLSPLLLIAGWATVRQASGVAALFILVNSAAGLLGAITSVYSVPGSIALWAAAAALGGWIGAEYGSSRFATPVLRQVLSVVLVVAGLKMTLA